MMVKHSTAVLGNISNLDFISNIFLKYSKTILNTKGNYLPNCKMTIFFQVPVLFIHPCTYPCPENVSLLRKVEGVMAL